jgi:hypothetical protein
MLNELKVGQIMSRHYHTALSLLCIVVTLHCCSWARNWRNRRRRCKFWRNSLSRRFVSFKLISIFVQFFFAKALSRKNHRINTVSVLIIDIMCLFDWQNLDVKRLSNERKEAFAAQFAAEATLRRIHSSQKDEEAVPFDAIIAPLESDIKKYRHEVT